MTNNKITKSMARKFASDLELVYRDFDALSPNDKTNLIQFYGKKIPGVEKIVEAMDQALVDDFITEDEWAALVAPVLTAQNQALLQALQKKNWRHAWTKFFAANFEQGEKKSFQNPGHAPLLARLAKIDVEKLDAKVRQQLVTGLLAVVEVYKNDLGMAMQAIDLLKSWQEKSAVDALAKVVNRMKQLSSLGNNLYEGLPQAQARQLLRQAYEALKSLDSARADTEWSLTEIVQGFVGSNFNCETAEYEIILALDVPTQFSILLGTDKARLLSELSDILLGRWPQLTPEQKKYLINHPDATVVKKTFSTLAAELEKNPEAIMDPALPALARRAFLSAGSEAERQTALKILAVAVKQDASRRDSVIDTPVRWQLWRTLDGKLDAPTVKQVLFLLEDEEAAEPDVEAVLSALSQNDEAVFLAVRRVLLKSREGLGERLAVLIREKTGQDAWAVWHALRLMELIQETSTLSVNTLESVRLMLSHGKSTAREVEAGINVLKLARNPESAGAIVEATLRHSTDEAVVKAANAALSEFGASVFAVVEKMLGYAGFCFGEYLAQAVARDRALRESFLKRLSQGKDDEATRCRMIESLGQAGYEAELAGLLGQIVRDPKSSLPVVESAAYALVVMNNMAVIPQLENIFARQRQDHSPAWMDALTGALAFLGQADAMDPEILATLRSWALPPEVKFEPKKSSQVKSKTSIKAPKFTNQKHAQWWRELPAKAEEFVTKHMHLSGAKAQAKVKELLEMEKNNYEKLCPLKSWSHAAVHDSLVFIPAGWFMMGSENGGADEKPVHAVWVSSFLMMDHEVTNRQYEAVMGFRPSTRRDGNGDVFSGDDQPVVGVSHADASAFAKKTKLVLPTEAQWEYAAKGGWGNDYGTSSGALGPELAVYGQSQTASVKSKSPNPFGLWDMAGNVWEWCADRYGVYSDEAQINPLGPASGDENYNLRGGSWGTFAQYLRSAYRSYVLPVYSSRYIGFRCVRSSSQDGT